MADAALENVTHCLALAEAQNDELNTFITLTPEQARTDAAAADAAATEGRWLGLLHGMPIAIKDNIDTAGIRTTSGAGFWAERVPNDDAPVVKRLKAAGAVIVGKATLGELVFDVRSHNPVVGYSKNPWNRERSPGGSSGGSAAALAADMCIGTRFRYRRIGANSSRLLWRLRIATDTWCRPEFGCDACERGQ